MTTTNEHGHVDEAGNVFLNTEQGPVKVGQYTVGDPQEGLAFFSKRFEDLVSEINIALTRLREGKGNADSVKSLLDRIEATLTSPNMLGNLESLRTFKVELEAVYAERKEEMAAKKAELKAAALARREEITALAESLANSTQWKATGEKFKELLDEWKKIPNADRAKEQELWKRFSHARSAFDKARRTHFSNLDQVRSEATTAKQALIKKASELAESTDWNTTANSFKKLMSEWKTLPRTAKNTEDKLWNEFKTVQDKFFEAKNAAAAVADEALGGNLKVKQELLAKAESLLPITNLDQAKAALRDIQTAWEKAGHVPRVEKDKIERRLKAVEDAIRKTAEEQWNRSKPEVKERANSLIATFTTALAKIDQQIESAKAAGKDKDVERLNASREQTASLLEAAQQSAQELP